MVRLRRFGGYVIIPKNDEKFIEQAKNVLYGQIAKVVGAEFIIKPWSEDQRKYTVGWKANLYIDEPDMISDKREPKAGDVLYSFHDPDTALVVEDVGSQYVYFRNGYIYQKEYLGKGFFYEQENAKKLSEFYEAYSGAHEASLLEEGKTPPPIAILK